ncbi:flagellar biosynthesis protein FlhF, partial [Rubrivivax gelatinosus]|nr:flagellar biosynthesis protein FlhF [Rubrivivax gelatinosus]
MNVKRFTARTSREALALVRQAFGDDAVVMSTRPCADGVEVLAMAPESLQQLERVSAAAPQAPRARAAAPRLAAPRPEPRVEPSFDAGAVDEDVEQLEMSTLSFQDYVRERMLKRRQTELAREAAAEPRQPGAVSTRRAEAPREEAPVRAAAPAAEPRARAAAAAAA